MTGQSALAIKDHTSLGVHWKTFWSNVYDFVSFVNNVNIINVEHFHIRSLYIYFVICCYRI